MSRKRIKTLVDRRDKISAAIDEILTAGQSMSLDDGISYTRASLPRLEMMLNKVEGQIARANGRNPLFQATRMSGMY